MNNYLTPQLIEQKNTLHMSMEINVIAWDRYKKCGGIESQ
jgi:hypothetical protein